MSKVGGAVSSSSMISLQRSMHSSQMKTPGPAISFLTWRWDLPQKEQRSCSLESVGRATCVSLPFGLRARRASVLGDHPVDDAVLLGLLRAQEVVALRVLLDLVELLPGVVGDDLVQPAAQLDDLAGVDLDVRRLPLEARGHLVDEDLRVRQRHPLALRPAAEQQRAHRHGDADADRLHIGLDEVHRVVDRETRVHGAARRVDVERDVLVGILGLQMQELGDDQVGDLIVHGGPEEDDPLVQQAGVDVERTLPTGGLLDDHRYEWAHGPRFVSLRSLESFRFTGSAHGPLARRRLATARCGPSRVVRAVVKRYLAGAAGFADSATRSSALRCDRSSFSASSRPLARSRSSSFFGGVRSPGGAASVTASSISSSLGSRLSASAIAASTASRLSACSASGLACSIVSSSGRPEMRRYASREMPWCA